MKKELLLLAGMFTSQYALGANLTVEELRIDNAKKAMPEVFDVFADKVKQFNAHWAELSSYQEAKQLVNNTANSLWLMAKRQVKQNDVPDDRVLYWTRLAINKIIRTEKNKFSLSQTQIKALIAFFEKGSRGRYDLEYTADTPKKILLTGFDPFLLDRNINQSNPSGLAALLLDGEVIEYKGIKAEINTVMIPVRYGDFDQGLIEDILAPYYALENVDMVVTVSMGRKDFDLERFPGKRRSVTAPDNVNIYSGGDKSNPVISQLHNKPLPGNEFVEFSLPVAQMQKADKPFKVKDNRNIIDLEGTKTIQSLSQLTGKVAVQGGGGGYLSNEISYRSIRLRDQLNSNIPTGHIHTPRIKQFDPTVEMQIVEQITQMLKYSIEAL